MMASPANGLTEVLRPTVLIDVVALSEQLGVTIALATETFQHTGSFKFRAAYNVALRAPHSEIIAASSGNFGQALAYACRLIGKSCIVVMPTTSAAVKVESVRAHGATVDLIDTTVTSRADRLAQIAREHPGAYVTNAYDDLFVIEGNATLGAELAASGRNWDSIIVPVGGGGLISGIANGLRAAGNRVDLTGAEPAIANDAARSLREGHVVANASEPPTIADGARTISLGRHNWPIIQKEVRDIVEVSEESIAEAVRLLFRFANLKVEPTGALSVGAILEQRQRFAGQSICCVISGGNVDADVYAGLLSRRVD
jgi:threonine dehydratase